MLTLARHVRVHDGASERYSFALGARSISQHLSYVRWHVPLASSSLDSRYDHRPDLRSCDAQLIPSKQGCRGLRYSRLNGIASSIHLAGPSDGYPYSLRGLERIRAHRNLSTLRQTNYDYLVRVGRSRFAWPESQWSCVPASCLRKTENKRLASYTGSVPE